MNWREREQQLHRLSMGRMSFMEFRKFISDSEHEANSPRSGGSVQRLVPQAAGLRAPASRSVRRPSGARNAGADRT